MEIPVVVEQVDGNGFRARVSTPEVLTVDGSTRDAVLGKMRHLLQERLAQVEVVRLDFPLQDEEKTHG